MPQHRSATVHNNDRPASPFDEHTLVRERIETAVVVPFHGPCPLRKAVPATIRRLQPDRCARLSLVEPERIKLQVANSYLEVKRRQAL